MRCLKRNMQTIWYAKYNGKTPLLDSDGNETGEYVDGYSVPKTTNINVYATAGNSRQEAFGYNLEYSRTMVTCDKTLNLEKSDALWVDVVPELNANGTLKLNLDGSPTIKPDYSVSSVGYSQNTTDTTYAIRKVE